MKKLNSKGFSPLYALLIIAIVGALGGIGYYVYRNQQDSKKPSSEYMQSVEKAKNEQDAKDASESAANGSNAIEITALKVKVNDPDKRGLVLHAEKVCAAECSSEDSYFIKDSNSDYFERCKYPAGISKLSQDGIDDITSNPDSFAAKHTKKVGNSYYYVSPGSNFQSPCANSKAGDEKYEDEIQKYIMDNIVQI